MVDDIDNKIAIQAALTRQMFAASNKAQITSVVLAAILAYMQRDVVGAAIGHKATFKNAAGSDCFRALSAGATVKTGSIGGLSGLMIN